MDNETRNLDDVKFRELLQKRVTNRVSAVGKDLMEFRSNFQQSAQGLIDSVSHILNTVEEEFLQDLRQELSQVESSVRSRLEPELRGQMESEVRQQLEGELEHRMASAKHSGAETALQQAGTRLGLLDAALKEITLHNNQVDILTCYLDKAALFASRAALFVVKSGNLVGWQARGFEGDFNNASVKTLMFSADRDNLLRKVSETRTACCTATAGNPEVLEIVSKFGPLGPDSICAIPLVVRDKTVAVLYADSGLVPNTTVDKHSLEIVTTVVSLTVELSSARAKLGIKAPEASAKDTVPAPTAAAPSGTPAPSVPPVATPASEPSQHIPESSARQAPSAEPAAPPFAPAPAGEPVQPAAVDAVPVTYVSPPSPGEINEADQKLHNDARRFARLLVSEIKLYNEQKVQAGRRDKNLYSLLRDDIDKSREMYEKRVAPGVAAQVDYFYDELVRILADNQVSSLGAECPGPALSPR
ncbi:MAG: hypothetical protein L0387_18500 [Acidobacteria bacterium]|nr:hypothetical protein [Acidobacteriota bacterium]MCI0724475.1 hypothetical protein [Acidobacteriota bacterium]